jgi:hypothetical protein
VKTGIFLLLLFAFASLQAQERVLLSFNPGMNFQNSENSMKTMANGLIGWSPGFSLGYENDCLSGFPLSIEYHFTYSHAPNAMEFPVTSSLSPDVVATYGANIIFVTNNIDFAFGIRPLKFLLLEIGPSLSAVYRTIRLSVRPENENTTVNLDDRLASVCAGASCSFNLEFPMEDSPRYVFLFYGIKLRYLHSLWFDSRGRDISNYYQSILLGELQLGIGYAF